MCRTGSQGRASSPTEALRPPDPFPPAGAPSGAAGHTLARAVWARVHRLEDRPEWHLAQCTCVCVTRPRPPSSLLVPPELLSERGRQQPLPPLPAPGVQPRHKDRGQVSWGPVKPSVSGGIAVGRAQLVPKERVNFYLCRQNPASLGEHLHEDFRVCLLRAVVLGGSGSQPRSLEVSLECGPCARRVGSLGSYDHNAKM